jgi:hypothetical protein
MASESLTINDTAEQSAKRWPATMRVGFRFCFVYIILYCLSNQILSSVIPIPDLTALSAVRGLIFWVAQHVFRITTPLVYTGSGSGDKTFDWVLDFCNLTVAAIAAVAWSLADGKRMSYPRLANWLRLGVRVALAGQMLVYGFVKVVPLQMHSPYLFQFLEPLRNQSPMGVLWTSVGASPAYEMFAGCAELTAGFLLMFPRTVALGALLCLADMVQVFALNMAYDVPVKLFSFHLILLALFLVAPDLRSLFLFFFRNRPAALEPSQPLFRGRRANRIAGVVLTAVWLWMIGGNVYGDCRVWYERGGGRPKSPLYGIWNVESLTMDGKALPLDVNNLKEWRRVVFDFPASMQVQTMDDQIVQFTAPLDAEKKTLALKQTSGGNWQANFTFDHPAADQLVLDGVVDGHQEHLTLRRMDAKTFELTKRGFHWISEYPYHR